MKELKDTISSAVAAVSADTVNAEGAPAWTMRDADRLVQLAMTGTLGNAFYASAQEVTADAVRLSRFCGEDPLYAWILASREGAKGVTPERVAAAEEAHPALAARRDFIRAVESGDEETALRLLRADALDLDSLSNWYNRFTPAMWRAAARRMPAMRFLKTMGKLIRENALEMDVVQEKISVERLRAAKVFPFRLYAAWAALNTPIALPPPPAEPKKPAGP